MKMNNLSNTLPEYMAFMDTIDITITKQTVYYNSDDGSLYPSQSMFYDYKTLKVAKFYPKVGPQLEDMVWCSMIDCTNPKTFKVAPYEEDTTHDDKIFFLAVISYLLNIGAKFDLYTGVKDAYSKLEQLPIDNNKIKLVKAFYSEMDIKIHNSGEIPIPSNLADYVWMKYVDFNSDYTSFTIRPKYLCGIDNPIKEALYTKAEDQYLTTQYVGSRKEAYDNQLISNKVFVIQQSIALRAQADLDFLSGLNTNILPTDSSLKVVSLLKDVWDITTKKPVEITEIVLVIGSFKSLIEIVQSGCFPYFTHQRSKYGTPLRVQKTYTLYTKNHYGEGNSTLSHLLNLIDDNTTIKYDLEAMKVLMFDLLYEFKSSVDLGSVLQIENYFLNNGLEKFLLTPYTEAIAQAEEDDYIDSLADMYIER